MGPFQEEQGWIATTSLVILAAIALGVALNFTQPILVPFVLAIFIASLVSPVLDFLELRWKVPHFVGVLVSVLIVLICMSIFSVLIVYMIQTVVREAGSYSDNLLKMFDTMVARLKDSAWLEEAGIQKLEGDLRSQAEGMIIKTFGSAFGVLTMLFFTIIFVIFLLSGRNPRQIQKVGIYADIDYKIRRYLTTKIFTSALTGILTWTALTILGVQLAAVFGMLAFLLNFIPTIGSSIAVILPIPMAVAQFDSMTMILLAIILPGSVQVIVGGILDPEMMGQNLNLHPATVVLCLTFWGLLWGVAGALLAVPLTAVIRIVLMQFDTLRPVGDLLAGHLPGYEYNQDH